MKLTSPAFRHNETIPSKYTCDGENINPPLEISGVPKDAKSLVLIVDDPDAPSKTWTHWIVYNISPETKEIIENSTPGGTQGMNDFGKSEWGGPCPPSGTHRYFFKLYALNKTLDLPNNITKEQLEKAIEGAILDTAELIGVYKRQ